jgi:flagellar biosynthesis chaperone FliJ
VTAWPLAAVLALRRREEDAARAALADAVAAAADAERALEAIEAERAAWAARGDDAAAGLGRAATLRELQAAERYRVRAAGEAAALEARRDAARDVVERAHAGVESAKRAVVAVHRAVEALERRRAEWDAGRRRARDAAEELAQDDRGAGARDGDA